MVEIASTAIIYPNVILGDNVVIEDFCVIGLPFNGTEYEKTTIGAGGVIRAGTYIYSGNKIGKNFHTGNKANVRELNQIGDDVSIGTLSVVEHHVIIGDRVRLHTQVFIPEFSILEDDCWLGPNTVLTNSTYPKHSASKNDLKGVRVGNNAKIGANSTLLPGVEIGKNSLVGAGSVVTKSADEDVIIAGNPAKTLRGVHYI